MKKLIGVFFIMGFISCTNTEIDERAKVTAELIGARSYSIGSEVFNNTDGDEHNKIRFSLNSVPEKELPNEAAVRDFETRLVMFFYAGINDKKSLKEYDGIELKFSCTNQIQKATYFSLHELEKVLSEMTIVESVIVEMNEERKISWNDNFDLVQFDTTYKNSMTSFLEKDFQEFGKITEYYIEGYDVWNINSNLTTLLKYHCETQYEKDLFIDFLIDQKTDKIIAMIAHEGDFKFSFY